ncbi:hypothetical protein NDU88_001563 [Pleurodeles waltl]|uniref:Uncharacterized protein n=1 Tax=Pleurodeles waltl TaxID=8319 RepID=A0AAV7LXZ4_PLEWA|nr:hypothetical protein NDU88_001563 [Pleurodeles waltl]
MKALADLRVRGRVSLWAVLPLKQQGLRHPLGRSAHYRLAPGAYLLSCESLFRESGTGSFALLTQGCVARLGSPLLGAVGGVGSLRSHDAGLRCSVGGFLESVEKRGSQDQIRGRLKGDELLLCA